VPCMISHICSVQFVPAYLMIQVKIPHHPKDLNIA
jgi:hypothetical protein